MKKLYEKKRADLCHRMDRSLLCSAVLGKSAEQGHRSRIRGKRRFLRFADGRAFRLYPKERLAESVWVL